MKLRVGTRPSELSIKQTLEVIEALRSKNGGDLDFEIIKIKTRGDIDRETPLYKIPVKGIFEKEVDLALVKGEVDFVVHSMKDYPTIVDSELLLASVPKRKSPYDVVLCRGCKGLRNLPTGSRVGTSSLRRIAHIKNYRPDLNVVPIRGNVDTRIRKLQHGDYDAIIIAEVGIQRLNLNLEYEVLSFDVMVPAAGQGALAVVCRRGDLDIIKLLKTIEDPISRFEVEVERRILRLLNAGCRTPIGVNAKVQGSKVVVSISSVSPDFKSKVYVVEEHDYPCSIDEVARRACKRFEDMGGLNIVESWRKTEDCLR
ncbi:MAG: hydroxymethylbilane synthase [Candidatus Nezhaarchaeales archaeon]